MRWKRIGPLVLEEERQLREVPMPIKKQSTAKVKSGLAKLKKSGLYTGDLRKEPTRYAKSLTKRYADVIAGRAKVVTIAKTPVSSKNKGVMAARAKARELSQEYGKTVRSKQDKIIVRTARPDERVYYSRELDTIVTRYKDALGKTLTHEYIRSGKVSTIGNVDVDEDDEETSSERLPALKDGQSYALPFSRGSHGVSYTFRATEKEILDLAYQYENRPAPGASPYQDAMAHVQLVYPGKARRVRKKKTTKRKRKSRAKKTNVIAFKPRKL